MRSRSLALIVLLLSSVFAGCTAIGADGKVAISLPAYHVGDRASYNDTWTWLNETGNLVSWSGGTALTIEAPSEAADRWGRVTPTTPVREDWLENDDKYAASRCHLLEGGVELVREDILEGITRRVSASLFGVADYPVTWEIGTTARFTGACMVFPALADRSLVEGDRLASSDITLGMSYISLAPESRPATPATFEGRAALAFEFDGAPGGDVASARLVLADGIAGIAILEVDWTDPGGFVFALQGFAPGSGSEVRDEGARLTAPPAVERQPADWMRVDDSAWPVRLRFDEALAAIHTYPRGEELAPFLATHPKAVLHHAWYKGGEISESKSLVSDGIWYFGFSDGVDALGCLSESHGGTQTSVLPIPRTVFTVNCWTPEDMPDSYANPVPVPTSYPSQVASTASLVSTLNAHGLAASDVVHVRYWLQQDDEGNAVGHIQLETVPYNLAEDNSGGSFQIENIEASLVDIREMRVATQVSPLAVPQSFPADSPTMDRPDRGTLLAVGGGALILGGLLVKLFIALFSRILGAQMLENPVRARIYEQIRAAPGAHREEIIEFAGIGNGATRHHLRKLTAHGFVFEVATGGFTRYYPAGEVPLHVAQEHAILRTGRARDVFELYTTHPDMTLREAARELEMSAPSVHRVLKRLQREGLLVKEHAKIPR